MASAARKLNRNHSRSPLRPIALLLGLLLIGGGVYAYMNQDIIEQAKALVGLAEPAEEGSATASTEPPPPPAITDPKAVEALNMAQVWVQARLAKGKKLIEINESLDVPDNQKEFWKSITLSQGAITAIPAKGSAEHPVLLLPMQDRGNLTWVCAGDIPPAIESICAQ